MLWASLAKKDESRFSLIWQNFCVPTVRNCVVVKLIYSEKVKKFDENTNSDLTLTYYLSKHQIKVGDLVTYCGLLRKPELFCNCSVQGNTKIP